jgi:hypothetical protein
MSILRGNRRPDGIARALHLNSQASANSTETRGFRVRRPG